MRILLAGGSGFIGSALTERLIASGYQVVRLVRREARTADEVSWNPSEYSIDWGDRGSVDAIINLAGESLAAGRWTPTCRDRIRHSRIDATETLLDWTGRTTSRPKVWINASAVGYYGSDPGKSFDESSPVGRGFLADVCREWENLAIRAESFGLRVVRLRFGLVLSKRGGALAKMLPVFRAGLGGRLGHGRQWWSWIALDDAVEIAMRALSDSGWTGPINVVAPESVTNAEFTRALGRALHRPAVVTAPAWALKLIFGQMAEETLLASTRVVPGRLSALGYVFKHPDLHNALSEPSPKDVRRISEG